MTSTDLEPNALRVGTVVMLAEQWDSANNPNVDLHHWQIQKFIVTESDGFFKVEIELAEDPSIIFWIDRAKVKVPKNPSQFFD